MKRTAIVCCFLAFAMMASSQEKSPVQSDAQISSRPGPAVVSIFACDEKGRAVSHATGFFVSSDGILVSTRHAIQNTAGATVQMNDGRILNVAGVIAEDPLHDLVLLKVNGKGFAYLKLGAFEQARKGTGVTMIVDPYTVREGTGNGKPSHFNGRTVSGTIAAVNNLADDYQWFSIRIPIRKGESGSPILNEAGDVTGMVRAFIENGDNTCFAISVDYIMRLLLTPAGLVPKPVAQLEKRQYDEIFDDLDFKAGIQAANDGEYHEAKRRMELAVKRFPESGAFHVILGSCYARLSMWSDANREFNRAILIKPDNAMAWASLGMTLMNQGKPGEAAAASAKAASLKSDLPDTWFNVAGVYVILKRYEEARAMLRRLQDFETPEADEMAEKLTRALEIANAQVPPAK